MKKLQLVSIIVLIVVIAMGSNHVAASAGSDAGEGLFTDSTTVGALDVSSDQTISRVRYVTVRFDLIPAADPPHGVQFDYGTDLTLNLFNDASYHAVLDNLVANSPHSYSWVGHIEGIDFSNVTLVVEDGVMAGNIVFPGGFYEVRYVGNGVHAIYQVDQSKFPAEAESIPVTNSDSGNITEAVGSLADDGSQIDVLVVYDSAARTAAGGTTAMNTLIDLAVTETNTGYSNSGVAQRIRLVYKAEVTYDETGFDWNTTLDRLTGTSDGYMDNVHTLRDTYGADEVVLLVNNHAYCGLAWLMTTVSNAFKTNAFAVVDQSCATGYYSFSHEMGHNMGATHDRANAGGPGAYSYSYGYQAPDNAFRTIMAYNCTAGCTRVNYWSNPDITYGGQPMGVNYLLTNSADNRRTLNNTAFTVANFRASVASIPGAATLISPSGAISDFTPTFTWNRVAADAAGGNAVADAATWYRLWIDGPSGHVFDKWYTAAEVGCTVSGPCSVSPGLTMAGGSYIWWIHTYNSAGYGPWSSSMSFTIPTPTVPGVATLISPSGLISDYTPTFTWNRVAADAVGGDAAADPATWYALYLNGPSGNLIFKWYTAAEVGCTILGPCSVSPGLTLAGGSYTWWVRTFNSAGYGPWSSPMNFSLAIPTVPGKPTLVLPSGAITNYNPTYTWNRVAADVAEADQAAADAATWYYLYVLGPSGQVIGQWYTAAQVGCASGTGTCSATPSVTLAGGAHSWWVIAWNSAGYGPWSNQMDFSLPIPTAPGKPTLLSPSGSISNYTPTYTWNQVLADKAGGDTVADAATWYYLWVSGPSGQVVGQWFRSSDVCNGSTCAATPAGTLPGGAYSWWVVAWNNIGYGSWSDRMDFTLPIPTAPGAATLISPSTTITSMLPTFTWNKVIADQGAAGDTAADAATWYYLYIYNYDSGYVIDGWYQASDVCGVSTCSTVPAETLWYGNWAWWVRTWNPVGYGPWSSGQSFTINSTGGFWENFSSSATNWVVHSGAWSIVSNAYYTTLGLPNANVSSSYNATYTNVDYYTRLWRNGCDACATYINIRGTPTPLSGNYDWNSAYSFGYNRNGSYTIWKGVGGSWTQLQSWTYTSALNTGSAWNSFEVAASGNSLFFFINGTLVWTGTDAGLASGVVGIEMYSNGTSGNQVWVDYAGVDTYSDQNPRAITATVSAEQQALNDAANKLVKGMAISKNIGPASIGVAGYANDVPPVPGAAGDPAFTPDPPYIVPTQQKSGDAPKPGIVPSPPPGQ